MLYSAEQFWTFLGYKFAICMDSRKSRSSKKFNVSKVQFSFSSKVRNLHMHMHLKSTFHMIRWATFAPNGSIIDKGSRNKIYFMGVHALNVVRMLASIKILYHVTNAALFWCFFNGSVLSK